MITATPATVRAQQERIVAATQAAKWLPRLAYSTVTGDAPRSQVDPSKVLDALCRDADLCYRGPDCKLCDPDA